MLQEMGYDSDPVKAWKQAQDKVERFVTVRFKTMERFKILTFLCVLLERGGAGG